MTKSYIAAYCRHRVIELLSFSPHPLLATCVSCGERLSENYLKTKYYDADHGSGYWLQTPTYNSIINPSVMKEVRK